MRMYNPEWEAIKDSSLRAASADLQFNLNGTQIPADHAHVLRAAITGLLPWLADVSLAGIHAIAGSPSGAAGDTLALNRRAKLVLRLPVDLTERAQALCNQSIDLGCGSLNIGTTQSKPLLPFATLYAHMVDFGTADEAEVLEATRQAFAALDIEAGLMCGKQRKISTPMETITGYSLMVHDIAPDASLRLQEHGLGEHRLLGCGLFVPHKSIKEVSID